MNNLFSIVWQWDPTLVMLGDLDIRWYGLMWAVAWTAMPGGTSTEEVPFC